MESAAILVANLSLGSVLLLVGRMIKTGDLTINHAIGLRTKATLSSPGAWKAGHDVAAPYILCGAIVALTSVVVAAAMIVLRISPTVVTLSSLGVMMITLVIIAVGSVRGHAAARRHAESNAD